MTAQRVFAIAGICIAVAFTFVTPPFQVPDEVGHFWRAVSIAYGDVLPQMGLRGATVRIPDGYAWIVNLFWREHAVKFTREQFRSARLIELNETKIDEVVVPAAYTPVPYAPQICAAFAGRVLHLPPPLTFYLGRMLNALAFVAIIAAAIGMAPDYRWLFAGSALLPMAMFLAASWSPDAFTIAAVYFFVACALRANAGDVALLAISGAVVGLCKPAYFLVVLLVFAIRGMTWRARLLIVVITAAAVALSIANAQRASVPTSHGDPAAQVACMRAHPSRFPQALAIELRTHGAEYADQTAGRLGLLDVHIPKPVVWVEGCILILMALGCGPVTMRVRVAALFITTATIAGIFFASYLGWTPPCALFVDGVQGRYLLPVVPLAFLLIAMPLVSRDRLLAIAVLATGAGANAAALVALAVRYY